MNKKLLLGTAVIILGGITLKAAKVIIDKRKNNEVKIENEF